MAIQTIPQSNSYRDIVVTTSRPCSAFAFSSLVFRFFQVFRVYLFPVLGSYFRVHFFIRCFYCLIQFLPPISSQLSLSLCLSRCSRHINLASFVIIFFLFACFIHISFGFFVLYIQLDYTRLIFSESLVNARRSEMCGFCITIIVSF